MKKVEGSEESVLEWAMRTGGRVRIPLLIVGQSPLLMDRWTWLRAISRGCCGGRVLTDAQRLRLFYGIY